MKIGESEQDKKYFYFPKLQLALDLVDLKEAEKIIKELKEYVDILEFGTPFILRYGVEPIRKARKQYPCLTILADFKIADAGEHEAHLAFESGADMVTVLAAAPDSTIKSVIKQSELEKKEVMADTVGVANLAERLAEIEKMGINYICAHTGLDEQHTGISTLKNLIEVRNHSKKAKIAVAGGINISNIGLILDNKPDIVIIGSSITSSTDKIAITSEFKKIMDERK